MSLQEQLAINDENWEGWGIQECLPLFQTLCPAQSDKVSKVSLMYWFDEHGDIGHPIIQAILKSMDMEDRIEIFQYIGD